MATDSDTYYVRCSSCGWHSYRSVNGEYVARGKRLVSTKPCKRCGRKQVRVINERGQGTRGPAPEPIRHGTRVGFKKGCRCKRCVAADRTYQRERYRLRKRSRR